MTKVISTSSSLAVTLTASDNPVTITSSGTIKAITGSYALVGPTGSYNITNYGLVSDTSPSGVGIGLLDGGMVTNTAATAQVIGMTYGIKIAGATGSVTNFGTVSVLGGSSATYASAIVLRSGGSVSNATGGVITGETYAIGVSAAAAATVTNAGTITAGTGIVLTAGGTVSNSYIIQAYNADAIDANASTTITNSGRIQGYDYGISLLGGGSITNVANALINTGDLAGVSVSKAFSINNSGTINGGLEAVLLGESATGVVSNATGGLIQGRSDFGIEALGAGTITNDAQIEAPIQAVYLQGGGLVSNNGGGIINGITSFGVHITGGAGTVINSGNIDGGATAVGLASGFNNVLELMPSGHFSGKVDGGNTIGAGQTSTIELLGSAGTLDNMGVSIVNFGSVAFAAGDPWLVSGNTVGIAGGEVFGDFQTGDTLQITGVANESISGFNNGTLTLTGSEDLSVVFSDPEFTNFHVVNDATTPTASDITVTCYAEGTRILTPGGEVPIEDLREGDLVVTVMDGATAPVRWKGWRRVQPMRHRRPEAVQPVRIRAGAFGSGRPHADLLVSPDHAIYVDGVLVPARLLLNGVTIVQADVTEITYFHLELPEHAVILAQGLACESYLNTGDRSAFANGGGAVALHPDFNGARWEGLACAELVLTGERLSRIRADLAARARRWAEAA
jgi:hypothetical protein